MVSPILRHASLADRANQRLASIRRAGLVLALTALACGDAAAPDATDLAAAKKPAPPAPEWRVPTPLLVGNQLQNPGFEAGMEHWGTRDQATSTGFEIVEQPVHSGRGAAHLVAFWRPGIPERPVSVRSATQEISPPRFPDRIGGFYRVDRWDDTPGRAALQLQIMVIALGDPKIHEIVKLEDVDKPETYEKLDNFQLRYQLAGPATEPEDGGNVRTLVVGTGPPELASWVRFDLPVKSDFAERWGHVPDKFRQLRIMFTVRWDDKEAGAPIRADVYYDDLFFGFEDL